MAYPYDNEYFVASAFLVLCTRVAGMIFALAMALCMGEDAKCAAPAWKYVGISGAAVAASFCQFEALKYVSFTVQMLGKSCKMLPVMLWGMALSGRSYVCLDWVTSLVVSAGVAEFLLTGPFRSANSDQGTSLDGLLYMLAFVALDAFTSAFQERLFQQHMTSKYNQMFYINFVSAIITLAIMIMNGHTEEGFLFCARHHAAIGDVILLSCAAILAQWFIYSLVQEYGALVFAATMNVRQIASIVASYLAFQHPVTASQVIGLVIIGTALTSRSAIGFFDSKPDEGKPMLKNSDVRRNRLGALGNSVFKKARAGCCPAFKV
eukprot:CAMPEP_0171189350 /NCGR_PEP_ID=MMETSP0790-20130122/18301_1 /TAXON_ID=2925 /ORGANISM="Alexandrium catenella, Strain OF101" /LENGTH=320 /DNA_ID=CAMNT_0011654459 /DNA_START=232 /DNA_END=1194 /DNA_ORIENTATION=-